MLPNLLVIGCRGQVGWELMRTLAPLGRVVGVDVPRVDLTRPDSLRDVLEPLRPAVILNAAAYTAVDRAESEPDLARQINAEAPGWLAREACRLGAWFIHYSTDYVFDGTKLTAWVEDDPPAPLNAYGRSKLAGDRAVQAAGGAHLIFRLCWVYGGRGQNFLRTILRLATTREELRVVHDQHGCPTWARLIAEATAQALGAVLRDPDPARWTGVYHLACGGQTTWHGFASAIVDRLPAEHRRCRAVTPIPTSQYPTPARRPAHSVLDCSKLERLFSLALPDWDAALTQCLESPVEGFEQLRFLV